MLPDIERKRLLELLASAAWPQFEQFAKDLKACEDKGVEDAVQLLTRIETTPGLPTAFWELIVRVKGAIAGKVPFEDVMYACLKYQGLM